MTNILLANKEIASDNLPVGGIKQGDKSLTQSSENKDFFMALEQASTQAKESNSAENINVETSRLDNVPLLMDSGEESESEAQVDGAEIDVDHVLAQINWANKLDGTANLVNGGDSLPQEGNEEASSDSALDDYFLKVVDDAPSTNFNLSAEEKVPDEQVSFDEVDIELSQTASLSHADTLVVEPDIQLLDPETQLPMDQQLIDTLVQQTGLSEAELTALPPEDLARLITTAKEASGAVFSLEGSESRIAGLSPPNLSQQSKTLPEAENADKSSSLTDAARVAQLQRGEATDVSSRTENQMLQDKGTQFKQILGEKNQMEEASKLQGSAKPSVEAIAKAEKLLNGAELAVQLNSPKSNTESGAALTDTGSTLGADLKGLPGMQIGSTAQHKPEPPLFQLALKQSNENQMQEMIQRFSPVMKQQLVTMVSQGIQHAEIRLDPPELGPLVVRIQVQGDQTQVQFNVVQHQTRDIVEQALPRLREMLAEEGLQLTDSNVSQRDSGKDQGEAGHSERSQEAHDSDLDEISADETLLRSNQPSSYRSGIDYYA